MNGFTDTNNNLETYARRFSFLDRMAGAGFGFPARRLLLSRLRLDPQRGLVTVRAGTRDALIGEKNFQFKNVQVYDLLSVAVCALKKHPARWVLRAVQQGEIDAPDVYFRVQEGNPKVATLRFTHDGADHPNCRVQARFQAPDREILLRK